ncbi:MAG: hypothetical protein Pg6B_10290 [Candidatus Azobacteroides pseudotrichonymphae]|nr:MAG: hypothetical protein Pg6B_10290 [Candidatus Azobacteroides pseudotrichonymphae]
MATCVVRDVSANVDKLIMNILLNIMRTNIYETGKRSGDNKICPCSFSF